MFRLVESTEMSILYENQHLFAGVVVVSEHQNIYTRADEMFEQKRKRSVSRHRAKASYQTIQPGISTLVSLSDAVGPSLLSGTDLPPDTAVK